jgi:GNAT superfamily N-acetyltransferase
MSEIAVRRITIDDLEGTFQLVQEFKKEALDSIPVSFDETTVMGIIVSSISQDIPRIYVALDGGVIGLIAGVVLPSYFDKNKITSMELMWYVNQAHRGTSAGIKLMKEMELYAKERGADTLVMIAPYYSPSSKDVSKLYERYGYKRLETHYIKELNKGG